MAISVSAVAEQLLLIERELRLAGLWSEVQPSLEALSSPEPFCVDTLAFEQWLQWILLPRMKALLEAGEQLPRVSGIHPMAEMSYAGREQQLAGLFRELVAFDALFEASE